MEVLCVIHIFTAMSFSDKVLKFYKQLAIDVVLPSGVEVLNPYQDKNAFGLCRKFYGKYYSDDNRRVAILGINPGRFGAGLTGIPFTDPPKLEFHCGIPNDLPKKGELSADFIYRMIDRFGGLERFYAKFFISSVSPLGFTRDGKNLNYYDDTILLKTLEPFIKKSLTRIVGMGVDRRVVFCLGEGANFKYFMRLNAKEGYFEEVVPLAHPRFIMQYKRKSIDRYVESYVELLGSR